MSKSTLLMVLVAGGLLSGGQTHAQPLRSSETAGDPWYELEAVEQGFADVDPLSASLRDLQNNLRNPFGFERVYRVPGREDLLMRAHGGLYAVFPRSWYEWTQEGTVVMVPPQTTFFIGRPTAEMLGPVPAEQTAGDEHPLTSPTVRSTRLDEQLTISPSRAVGRLESRTRTALFTDEEGQRYPDGQGSSPETNPPDHPERPQHRDPAPVTSSMPEIEPRIIRDEAYRDRRLVELMRRAATRDGRSDDSDSVDRKTN